jgi:hypothetical protein
MQDWLKTLHGANQAFPAVEIAVKAAVALALGLLVGFEREWSNKDIGVRTFAMTAFLGLLVTLLSPPLLLFSGTAVLIVIVFTNLRSLQTELKFEATTSAALAIVFLLGVLYSNVANNGGHMVNDVHALDTTVTLEFAECKSHDPYTEVSRGRFKGQLLLR